LFVGIVGTTSCTHIPKREYNRIRRRKKEKGGKERKKGKKEKERKKRKKRRRRKKTSRHSPFRDILEFVGSVVAISIADHFATVAFIIHTRRVAVVDRTLLLLHSRFVVIVILHRTRHINSQRFAIRIIVVVRAIRSVGVEIGRIQSISERVGSQEETRDGERRWRVTLLEVVDAVQLIEMTRAHWR
jgi:hypothetical protein